MLDLQALQTTDPKALSPGELAEVFAKMLAHIGAQHQRIDSQEQAIRLRDAKLERVSFELARLKAWKFAAKTERMNAQQRQLFEETLASDEASLQAQLDALNESTGTPSAPATPPRCDFVASSAGLAPAPEWCICFLINANGRVTIARSPDARHA